MIQNIGMPDANTNGPLSPREATEGIHEKVGPDLEVKITRHAKERMQERGLIMGDILHVLKFGYVYEEGEPSTQRGLFKYRMECTTPNSGGRSVRAVVIPSSDNTIKLVSIMWADE